MKYRHPENVYGILVSKDGTRSERVLLGITESSEEQNELIDEYAEVFTNDDEDIQFDFDYTTREEMEEARRKAFSNLLIILTGPINTVITGLKAIKR